jgi:hypothetical protein
MLQLKSLDDIKGADIGWLKAKHHFAIGPYGNPNHDPIGNLIVFNDDEIAPHAGFSPHPHSNLEIVTYAHLGTVTHQDDRGHRGKTRAGDVQVMSAGTGIHHSEKNDEDVPLRVFQIWLSPASRGGTPRWGSKPFPRADRAGAFIALASGRNAEGALPIRSDSEVYGALLQTGTVAEHSFQQGDAGYLVPASGEVDVNGVRVRAREGLIIQDEKKVSVKALADSELVLVVTRHMISRIPSLPIVRGSNAA